MTSAGTAYHFAMSRPPDPERDAVLREAASLTAEFPGPWRFLSSHRRLHRRLPVAWRALAHRRRAQGLDSSVDLHHLFADDLRWCRLFDRCEKPYLLSLTTTLGDRSVAGPPRRPPAAVTVRMARDRARLEAAGWTGVSEAPAGARLAQLTPSEPPPGPPWRLLFASAPWTRRQFRTKGVEALLDAVAVRPDLRLSLLWRGVLETEMRRRLARRRLGERVELVVEAVDVGAWLARSHAVVLFPERSHHIVPYPHSLLEGLAAGRPIALSHCLGLADDVRRAGSGVVVDSVSGAAVGAALDTLVAGYATYQKRAAAMDCSRWATAAYVDVFRSLRGTLSAAGGGPTATDTAERNDSQP